MKTSCFFTYKGKGGISIARYAPKCFKAGNYFPALAPGPWFKSVAPIVYVQKYYEEILSELHPEVVWQTLHEMVYPEEPVLLCWEKKTDPLPRGFFCHRRLVADWFKNRLGKVVEEL